MLSKFNKGKRTYKWISSYVKKMSFTTSTSIDTLQQRLMLMQLIIGLLFTRTLQKRSTKDVLRLQTSESSVGRRERR